jgi:hypothetical protein
MSNQEGKQKSNDQGSGKAGGDSKPVEIIIVPPRL